MRYTKPIIADLGSASTKIQSMPVGNKGNLQIDADQSQRPALSTGGCYDLDE